MEDSENDYKITFPELSSWVEQIWPKIQHMLNVYACTVVQCICMCNADFHILHETNISFSWKWHIQVFTIHTYTVCPTHYQTQHFFNNSNINEDIAMKFEQEYFHCVRNEEECVCSVCQISLQYPHNGKIIKEMLGSIASGTPCINITYCRQFIVTDFCWWWWWWFLLWRFWAWWRSQREWKSWHNLSITGQV